MVRNEDLMQFLIDMRAEMRCALNLQKLDRLKPTDVLRAKKLKHLRALDQAIALGDPWSRAGQIAEMLKGTMPPPVGLEYDVRELRAIECTRTQSRIQQWLTRY